MVEIDTEMAAVDTSTLTDASWRARFVGQGYKQVVRVSSCFFFFSLQSQICFLMCDYSFGECIIGMWSSRCVGRWGRTRSICTSRRCTEHQCKRSLSLARWFRWWYETVVWLSWSCSAMDRAPAQLIAHNRQSTRSNFFYVNCCIYSTADFGGKAYFRILYINCNQVLLSDGIL